MPDVLAAILIFLAQSAVAVGLFAVPLRRRLGWLTLGVAAVFAVSALFQPETRTLEIFHWFASFEDEFADYGSSQMQWRAFPVDKVTATGSIWALVYAWYFALWGGFAVWTGGPKEGGVPLAELSPVQRREATKAGILPTGHQVRSAGYGFGAPLLLAISGFAVMLAAQKLAAPAMVVQPLGVDRMLWPATLAASVLLAARAARLIHVFLMLSLFVFTTRGLVAYVSKWLSENRMGTSLDIHSITDIANPLMQQHLEVAPDSHAQQMWLIWVDHLLIYSTLTLMSLGGLAFGFYMFLRAPKEGPPVLSKGGVSTPR